MDYDSRRIANSQRDRCFRPHHGWVRAKRCGFCEKLCHLDEMGIVAPPWRVRRRRGEAAPVHSCLTWYCSTQCAKWLDTSQPGWRHRAPRKANYDEMIADYDTPQMQQDPRPAKKETPPPAAPPSSPMKPGMSWADDGVDDIKFGSF